MFGLFRSTEEEEARKELDNYKRLLYNSGRFRAITTPREKRQDHYRTGENVPRETRKVKDNEPTK
jgi:hypothetical protein